jgi:hypothetical protein
MSNFAHILYPCDNVLVSHNGLLPNFTKIKKNILEIILVHGSYVGTIFRTDIW